MAMRCEKGVLVQSAKDSFYEMLRGRLSQLNAERTVVVRGVTRPGVLVDENETQSVADLPDCFHLRWQEVSPETTGPTPLLQLTCEISYATAGTAEFSGLDRGRCLTAMDAELLAATMQTPQNASKADYAALAYGGVPAPSRTRIWWSCPTFGETKVQYERLVRKASVEVMSWQEAGEL